MHYGKRLWLVCICLGYLLSAKAQDTSAVRSIKVAVFAPLYIDSAFTNDTYKLGKANLPKYLLPGLDFYNGVMLAIDSLNAEKTAIEVLIYDTKSSSMGIDELLEQPELQDVSLLIASFNNRNDIKPLADFAKEKNILLISATYPNDGGIEDNPNFVLLNPTLTAHIEAVYKYVHRTYPLDNITLFRRKGGTEDQIQTILGNLNKRTGGIPLKLKTIELTDSFTTQQVTAYLDSTKRNVVICGTLNEGFGLLLSKALSSSKQYPAVVIGMPTWDALRDIGTGIDMVYTTPYNYFRQDKLSSQLSEKYRARFAGRASDLVFKGFETMYRFSKLLIKYGPELKNNLSAKEFKLFNDFDIQVVTAEQDGAVTNYLENKKLYLVHKQDGKVKSVN
jgi:ABC-type branched-subunit amino acid transport system substrate-binding protein